MNKVYDEFHKNVVFLGKRAMAKDVTILHAALGIASESGEITEAIKHWKFQGHELNEDEISLELGDLLFYIELMSNELGITLDVLMKRNINKLKTRYPNGFEVEKSLKRDREKERQTAIEN